MFTEENSFKIDQNTTFLQNNSQDFDVNTPVSALTAGQMLALIQSQTKPLEAKVVGIDQKLDREINGLQTRINVLENEMKEQGLRSRINERKT